MTTHYQVLGVTRSATEDEIRFAYGRLAVMCHPDLYDNNPEKSAQMADLNVAYNVLKDSKKKKEYDKQLTILNKPCAACKGKGAVMKQKGFSKKVAVPCASCDGSGIIVEDV